MGLLSMAQEFTRSRPGRAFSNGSEWDVWSAQWCERCVHEQVCPLSELALLYDRTPAAWRDARRGYRNRYDCREFTQVQQ